METRIILHLALTIWAFISAYISAELWIRNERLKMLRKFEVWIEPDFKDIRDLISYMHIISKHHKVNTRSVFNDIIIKVTPESNPDRILNKYIDEMR